MFKLLLILSLVAYILYKVGGIFFRAGVASQQRYQQPPPDNTRSTNTAPRKDSRKDFKGGDYVDYEEVK